MPAALRGRRVGELGVEVDEDRTGQVALEVALVAAVVPERPADVEQHGPAMSVEQLLRGDQNRHWGARRPRSSANSACRASSRPSHAAGVLWNRLIFQRAGDSSTATRVCTVSSAGSRSLPPGGIIPPWACRTATLSAMGRTERINPTSAAGTNRTGHPDVGRRLVTAEDPPEVRGDRQPAGVVTAVEPDNVSI